MSARSSSSSSTSPLQIPLGSMISCISMSQSASELETRSESGICLSHGIAPFIKYGDNILVESEHRGSGLDLIFEPRSESRLGSVFQPVLKAASGMGSATGIGVTSYDAFGYYDATIVINSRGLRVESDEESGALFNATSSFLGSPLCDNPTVDCCSAPRYDCSSSASQEETCLNLPTSLLESKSFDTVENDKSSDIDRSMYQEPICTSTAYDKSNLLPCQLSQQFTSTPMLPNYQMLGTMSSVPLEWDDTCQVFDSNDEVIIKPQPCSHGNFELNSMTNAYANQAHHSNSKSSDNHDFARSPHLNQSCYSNPHLSPSRSYHSIQNPTFSHSSYDQSLYLPESLRICQQISFLEQQLHVHESSRLRYQLRQYQYFHNTYNRHESIYNCHNNPPVQVNDTKGSQANNIPFQLLANAEPFVPQYMIFHPQSVVYQNFHTQRQFSNQSPLQSHTHYHYQSIDNAHLPTQLREIDSRNMTNRSMNQHHQSMQQPGNSKSRIFQSENQRSGRSLPSNNSLSSSISISTSQQGRNQDVGESRVLQSLPQHLLVNGGAISANHRGRHSSMPTPQSHNENRSRNSEQNAFLRRHSHTPLLNFNTPRLKHHLNPHGPPNRYISSGGSEEISNLQLQHDSGRSDP